MRTFVLATLAFGALATTAHAEAIMLSPGQCIMIGSKEVCAMSSGGTVASQKPQKTQHVCRFGKHADSEVGNLKTYQLIEIVTQANGYKSETPIKNFGNIDKEGCEKEAARLTAEAKADAKETK